MKKNKNIWLLVLSLIGFGGGYIFTHSYNFGLCFADSAINTYDVSCHILFERIGDPLFYGMGALAIIFFILLFMPKAIPLWEKFAKWFIPIATLIFIFYPNPGSGDLFSPFPEQIFQWISTLYILISLIIIGYSFRK